MGTLSQLYLEDEKIGRGRNLCGHLLVLLPDLSSLVSPDTCHFLFGEIEWSFLLSSSLEAPFFLQLCPWSIVMVAVVM